MALKIYPLKCLTCSSPLAGFENDIIFFCPVCELGWDFSYEPPKAIKVSYAQTKQAPKKYKQKFFLPFYLYKVSFEFSGKEKFSDRIKQILDKINKIYIPAFRLIRENYFGDFGLFYTESEIELEEQNELSEEEKSRIGLAMRSIKDVEKYLTLYPLLIIDKRVDITGLNLHTNAELEKIWAVPFFDLEKTIQDSVLQKSFPSFALEGIDQLRKIF